MDRSRWLVCGLTATLLLTGLGLRLARGEDEESSPRTDTVRRMGKAMGLRTVASETLEGPTADVLGKVERITGHPGDLLKQAAFDRATVVFSRRNRAPLVFCTVAIDPATVSGSVVVAVDEDGNIHGAALLDEDGDAVRSWARFVTQFAKRSGPALATARPHADLAALEKKVATAKDDESRIVRALLAQRDAMHAQAPLSGEIFTRASAKTELDPATIGRAREVFQDLSTLGEKLRSMLGESEQEFVDLALSMVKGLDEMEKARAASDLDRAKELVAELRASCVSCHNLVDNEEDPIWRVRAANRVEKYGLGKTYFLLGHDVQSLGRKPEQEQAVATAIRAACLLVDGL